MKRSKVEKIIENVLTANTQDSPAELATIIMDELLLIGMKPPALDFDRSQVLLNHYLDPDVNMWEETFDQNPILANLLKKRKAWKRS